jgi:hypothetical protein
MEVQKRWMRQLLWVGITGVAGLLGVGAPNYRAQEVSPDHFTTTGIDGVTGKEQLPEPAPSAQVRARDTVKHANPQSVEASKARTGKRGAEKWF